MRKILLAFLTVFISLNITFTTFADVDPLDCLINVYVDDKGRWWTVYDMSLIPADVLIGSDDSALQNAPTLQADMKESSFVTTDNDMEVEINYAFADRDNKKYLDVTLEIGNGNLTEKPALCVVALYEGLRFKKIIFDKINVPANDIETADLSLDVTNCGEDDYVKVFIWDTFSTMRPLGELRRFDEINIAEKTILISKNNNDIFGIYLYSGNKKNIVGKSHVILYDPDKIQAVDLCGLSYEVELSTGAIENTDIIISEFDPVIGKIVYKFNYNVGENDRITGINNMIKFKAKQTLTNEEITYIIE